MREVTLNLGFQPGSLLGNHEQLLRDIFPLMVFQSLASNTVTHPESAVLYSKEKQN